MKTQKPTGYWTYDRCKEITLKYTTYKEFIHDYNGAYQAILKKGWTELTKHLEYRFKPNGYWTYERCTEESKKYSTYKEFRENSHAYNVIIKNGWWDELCGHLTTNKKSTGYWTYENCKKTALKYNNRKELCKNEGACYSKIKKNGWNELL